MKIKKVSSIILISAITIMACLIGFEIYLRKTHTYIIEAERNRIRNLPFVETYAHLLSVYTEKGKRLVPNSRAYIKNHSVSKLDILMEINSLGFRDDEIPEGKKPNEIRILMLGDSIVCGHFLPAEEVFVERTEHYLSESNKDKIVEVINAGVGDVGLEDELNILEEEGLETKPDIVIIAFYMNDSRPPWGFTKEIGARGWLRRHSLIAELIYANIKLKNWIKDTGVDRIEWVKEVKKIDWRNNRDAFLRLASLAKYDWGAAWEKDSWDVVDREFEKLKTLSIEYSFQVGVVVFPAGFQVVANHIEDTPQKVLKEKTRELGFKYLDLLPTLREYRHENLFFDHCHLGAKGNDIVGSKVAEFIAKDMLNPQVK